MRKKDIDWEKIDPLLGAIPDHQIAAMYKVKLSSIKNRRHTLGIPAFVKKIDWTSIDQQLGVIPDSQLASMYKIDRGTIRNRRIVLGISTVAKKKEQKWALIDPLLIAGVPSLVEISHKFNVHGSSLYHRCRKLGLRRRKPWPPCWSEIDPLLGTMRDGELARKFNILLANIFLRRKKLGIPPYQAKRVIDWNEIDPHLGTCTDKELAEMAGVSCSGVGSRRRMLGIPSFFESHGRGRKNITINWDVIKPYLGTTSDQKLANKYNVSITSIWSKRNELGMKPYGRSVDWEKTAHLFNKISDIEIAKMRGVSTAAVLHARRKLGMSSPKKDVSFIDQYLDTLSNAEIAEKFGLRRESVYRRRLAMRKKTGRISADE